MVRDSGWVAQLAPSPLPSPAKVQEEIDAVVGAGRAPCTEDRLRMPYTNAVIHELQRFHKTRIENFPRMTTQDVPFRGYTIPKVHGVPRGCAPRDRGHRGCTDICLCPCTVCTRLKAPGSFPILVNDILEGSRGR